MWRPGFDVNVLQPSWEDYERQNWNYYIYIIETMGDMRLVP